MEAMTEQELREQLKLYRECSETHALLTHVGINGLYYRGLALDAYSKIITALDVERVRVEMLTELSTKLARACSDARNSLAYVNHNYPDVSDRGARSERIENCSLALETAREVLDTY